MVSTACGRLRRASGTIGLDLAPLGFFFVEAKHVATAKGGSAIITLQCPDCKERNYTTVKNRRNDPDRLELKKFCSRCRSHTRHRETK